MRWTRVMGVIAIACVFVVLSFVASCTTTQTGSAMKAEPTREEMLAMGQKLVWGAGCVDCHTPGTFYGAPDTTRLMSGSELGWQGPWGVSYPRNLTPDMETGIGSWTEEQIVTAVKTGVRPDGSPLLPPMPWPTYSRGLSDEQFRALAAYLKSLPAVKHEMPKVIPPGKPVTGAYLTFPAPPAWDAQNLPAPPATAAPGSGGQ